jgi:hypothetical protein
LKEENIDLKAQLISGFYEEEYPQYTQGAPTNELQSVMTAVEARGLVEQITTLKSYATKLDEALKAIEDELPLIFAQYSLSSIFTRITAIAKAART